MRNVPHVIARVCSLATILTGLSAANVDELTVDLDIFNGQAGTEVPDAKEVEVGAFTVANINDTDGAQGIDSGQAIVQGEKDLMKLIIRKPSRKEGNGPLTLKLNTGSARVYLTSAKGTQVNLPKDYTYEEIPTEGLVLWAEAFAVSAMVRDIELEIIYAGASDKVRATGVWAEKTGFRNLPSDILWPDAQNPLRTVFTTLYGGKLGIQYAAAPVEVQYAMGMEFTVAPSGVGSEPGVKFDVTRQTELSVWFTVGAAIRQVASVFWPGTAAYTNAGPAAANIDVSNDDANNNEEDNTPANNHIYSIDGPGHTNTAEADQWIVRANFLEFVRVRFDDTTPSGNTNEGSRCSPKVSWYASIWSEKDGAQYKQRAGKGNNVAEGYGPILPAPTP